VSFGNHHAFRYVASCIQTVNPMLRIKVRDRVKLEVPLVGFKKKTVSVRFRMRILCLPWEHLGAYDVLEVRERRRVLPIFVLRVEKNLSFEVDGEISIGGR
jgi:hypothetical protein